MIGGEDIRESLNTANWTQAQRRIAEAEGHGSWKPVKPAGGEGALGEPTRTTIEEAREKFLRDAQHGRDIAEVTLKKYRLLSRDFESFTKKKGYRFIGEVTLDDLREFRESWFEAGGYTRPGAVRSSN
jgi:hypothetical protein